MSIALRIAGRALLFLSTRHRLLGIRDWTASLGSLVILMALLVVQWTIYWDLFSRPVEQTPLKIWGYVIGGIFVFGVIAWPAAAYIIKLRRNGITDADYSVETGFDYKAALESGGAGFDFLGMGAAKLRHHENEFRSAVRATVSSEKKIRLLLTDPQSPAVKRLEQHDNAIGYTETIDGSINFIKKFCESNPQEVSMRLYNAAQDSDFKPFRLFFAKGDCLISPFVKGTGVDNRGRNLPQIRITEIGWPQRDSATLYKSFQRYFTDAWESNKNLDKETTSDHQN